MIKQQKTTKIGYIMQLPFHIYITFSISYTEINPEIISSVHSSLHWFVVSEYILVVMLPNSCDILSVYILLAW